MHAGLIKYLLAVLGLSCGVVVARRPENVGSVVGERRLSYPVTCGILVP